MTRSDCNIQYGIWISHWGTTWCPFPPQVHFIFSETESGATYRWRHGLFLTWKYFHAPDSNCKGASCSTNRPEVKLVVVVGGWVTGKDGCCVHLGQNRGLWPSWNKTRKPGLLLYWGGWRLGSGGSTRCDWEENRKVHSREGGRAETCFCFILTDQRDTNALVHHGHGLNLAWRETCLGAGGLWEADFSPLKQPIKVQRSEAGPEPPQGPVSCADVEVFWSVLFWPILHSYGVDPGHQIAASAGRPRPLLPPATSTSSSRVRELSSKDRYHFSSMSLFCPRVPSLESTHPEVQYFNSSTMGQQLLSDLERTIHVHLSVEEELNFRPSCSIFGCVLRQPVLPNAQPIQDPLWISVIFDYALVDLTWRHEISV